MDAIESRMAPKDTKAESDWTSEGGPWGPGDLGHASQTGAERPWGLGRDSPQRSRISRHRAPAWGRVGEEPELTVQGVLCWSRVPRRTHQNCPPPKGGGSSDDQWQGSISRSTGKPALGDLRGGDLQSPRQGAVKKPRQRSVGSALLGAGVKGLAAPTPLPFPSQARPWTRPVSSHSEFLWLRSFPVPRVTS